MIAADIMSAPVFIVAPEDNLARARNLMLKHRVSRLLVVADGKLTGIITKKDIGYRLRQSEPVWRRRPTDRIPVQLLMTRTPVTVLLDTPVRRLAGLMIDQDISGVPVMDGEMIAGIVTKADILRSAQVNRIRMNAEELMEEPILVSRYHSLDHIIALMRERHDRLVVVNNDGTLAGILTETNLAFYSYSEERGGIPERDLVRLRRADPAGKKEFRHVVDVSAVAEDLMSRPVITVTRETPVKEVIGLMREKRINSVVVEDEGTAKGIVKRDDIIKEVAK